jgi:hypothetical protein
LPGVPEQEDFAIALGQLRERLLDERLFALAIDRFLGRGCRRPRLRLALEQRQMLLAADHGTRLVAGQVVGDRENERTLIAYAFQACTIAQTAQESFLCQIVGPLRIPYLAV